MKHKLHKLMAMFVVSIFAVSAFAEEVKTDYTDAIKNASVTSKDDWTIDGDGDVKFGDDHIKTSVKNLNFYQTVVLPAGQYKVAAQAAYRYGSGSVNEAEQAEYEAIKAGAETHLAKLYAETSSYKYEANVQNRWEGASDEDYYKTEGKVSVVEGKYVPNSSAAVKAWFDAGKYVNELVFNVQEEGEVIIGIAKSSTINDYTNIGAWTLTRLGDAEADPKEDGEEEGDADIVLVDCTNKVGTSKDAWHATGGPVNIDGISMPEKYETTTETTGDVMWQEITGLENGTYTVELWANARYTSGRGFESPAADGQHDCTYLFANNVELSIPVVYNAGLNNNTSHVLEGVEVTDGTLKMGMTKKAAGSNWHTIQIKSLAFHSTNAVALAGAKTELLAIIEEASAVTATDALTVAITAAQNVYDNSKSVDEVNATIASLKLAIVFANNTNAVAGATVSAPVVTDFVVNGTFNTNGVTAPWKTTTKAQNQTTATNQQGAFTGNFFENWNPSSYVGKIYQEIENIPNGLYELSICAFVNNFDATAQFVYANEDKKALVAGAPTAYKVRTIVTDNKIEIGLAQETAVANWMGIDNVSLKYFGLVDANYAKDMYNATKAEAEALKDKKMAPSALQALNEALAVEVDMNDDEALVAAEAALQEVVASTQASVDFYATNKLAIDAMFSLMESTNVYTAEAFLVYDSIANDYLAQYEAGTLTATVDNPATVHGWHAEVAYDEMLLSAFGTKNFDTSLYINTWSTEGETDGSDFKVPFFEYWTGDDGSVPVDTLTATVEGLSAGQLYGVEAWVRVRAKNGTAASAATGISLSVGDGAPVDVTEGDVIGESQFSHAVFTAYGFADAEGKLAINFNITEGVNVSWLSFKNLKYAEAIAPTREQKQAFNDAIAQAESHIVGFAAGEYAPYTNVEALEALAAAKAIDLNYISADVLKPFQEALETATWTANTEEMDFIYNGNFAVAAEGANYPKGWTRTNGWGQMQTNVEGCDNGTAYYNQPGSLVYGSAGVYTMPLAAETSYQLTFKYRSHEEEEGKTNKGVVASVLNGEDGLKEYKTEANPSKTNWMVGDTIFTTGAAGNYVLTLAVGENTWMTDVVLAKIPVEKVTLDKKVIDFLAPDSTVQLTAVVTPEIATDKTVTWTSSDEKVAVVDAQGNVTSKANGTALIVATAHNGKADTCSVSVTFVIKDVVSVELNKTTIDFLAPDSTVQLVATVLPETASYKNVVWTTSDETVATVDAEGNVTSVNNGTATITATAVNGVKATCEVTVTFTLVEVEEVSLNMNELKLVSAGATEQLVATITPQNATYKTITWTTSDEDVATVDAEGNVTAVADGTATITATAPNGESDTCLVTVAIPVPVAKVTLNKESISFASAGATEKLVATVAPVNATDKSVAWTTSDEKVATVDAEGNVTAVADGTAVITATADGKSATCTVTVAIVVEVSNVTLNMYQVSLESIGATVQLIATVAPADATDKTITWTSSDEKVATVDAEGNVTAVAEGNAIITAAASNGRAASCKVTVALPVIEVAEVTLNMNEIAFTAADSTVQLIATVAPADATDKTITWTSSDEKVATVDAEGNVTAVAEGNAVITATAANGVEATCTVTVVLPVIEVAEVALNLNEITFTVADSTVQLIATVAPADAADQTITWTSSDENVAVVDAEGNVTSVNNGTAIITATAANGVEATCMVTVIITDGIKNVYADGEQMIYDLSGRRVLKMVKGFYIVNGVKVYVK